MQDYSLLVLDFTAKQINGFIDLNSMKDCQLNYFSPRLGAGVLQIYKNKLKLKFFNEKGFCEYTHTITQ